MSRSRVDSDVREHCVRVAEGVREADEMDAGADRRARGKRVWVAELEAEADTYLLVRERADAVVFQVDRTRGAETGRRHKRVGQHRGHQKRGDGEVYWVGACCVGNRQREWVTQRGLKKRLWCELRP